MSEHELHNQYFCIAEDGSHFLANCVTCEQFLTAVGESNLLILSDPPECAVRHHESGFHYVPVDRVSELLTEEDPYGFGDFQWVDFRQPGALDELAPQEIAGLVYLGHKWEPLYSPYMAALGNRFAYLSHDDGWFLKLYCREANGIRSVLSKLIPASLSLAQEGIDYPELPEPVASELETVARDGLLLGYDLFGVQGGIEVHRVGRHESMDYVESHAGELRREAGQGRLLTPHRDSWTLS